MSEWALDIGKFAEKIELNVEIVAKKVGLDILKEIVERTPHDTGRARGNWQVGINQESFNSLDREDKTGASAVSQGGTIIRTLTAGDTVNIYNNVEYIMQLETGSSKQAPAGMVGVTIARFRNYVEEAARKIK